MTEARAKNPAFSLRALARKIGLSPAMTSRVMSGKRQVSPRLARQIVDSLLLDPQEQAEILGLFPTTAKSSHTDTVDPHYLQLNADHFRTISEWHYFAILSLFKTRGFKSDPRWIASRLGISTVAVKQALARLKRLELVIEDDDGNLRRSPLRYRTTDDVLNLSVRKANFESLQLALRSLESDPIDTRDVTTLTLAFPFGKMKEAKQMIRRFQDEFDARFENKESQLTEVYRLCISLFPLTRSKQEKRK